MKFLTGWYFHPTYSGLLCTGNSSFHCGQCLIVLLLCGLVCVVENCLLLRLCTSKLWSSYMMTAIMLAAWLSAISSPFSLIYLAYSICVTHFMSMFLNSSCIACSVSTSVYMSDCCSICDLIFGFVLYFYFVCLLCVFMCRVCMVFTSNTSINVLLFHALFFTLYLYAMKFRFYFF